MVFISFYFLYFKILIRFKKVCGKWQNECFSLVNTGATCYFRSGKKADNMPTPDAYLKGHIKIRDQRHYTPSPCGVLFGLLQILEICCMILILKPRPAHDSAIARFQGADCADTIFIGTAFVILIHPIFHAVLKD